MKRFFFRIKLSLKKIKVFKFCIIFALCLLSAELAGWLANRLIHGISYKEAKLEKELFISNLPIQNDNIIDQSVIKNLNIKYRIHPFFGYSLDENITDRSNNHGFWLDYDFPYKKDEKEFIVGFFGGSVSWSEVIDKESRAVFEQRILDIVKHKGYKKVKIFPFALGGYKQPQTFFIIAYYLDMIDMAIVIDGFNDIDHLSNGFAMEWPSRFPNFSCYRPLTSMQSFSNKTLLSIAELHYLNKRFYKITQILDGPILRHSLFAHSIWKASINKYYKDRERYLNTIYPSQKDNMIYASMTSKNEAEAEEQINNYLLFYENLSKWQWMIANDQGIPIFQFIQPNQYVRGSKPYSKEELSLYLSKGEDKIMQVSSMYEQLEDIVERLNNSGVSIYSLTYIFKDIHETVYRDACCHFNTVGREMIANQIMNRIEEADTLSTIKPAEK